MKDSGLAKEREQTLIVFLSCGTHNHEPVNDGPNAQTATSQQFSYAQTCVAYEETVNSVCAKEQTYDEGNGRVLELN